MGHYFLSNTHICQATDTMSYPVLSQKKNKLSSQILLPSHCSNTVNISTVVMLGFWLCQFKKGTLACGLCLLLWTEFFVWLFEFIICELG